MEGPIPRHMLLDVAGSVFPAARTRAWNETYRVGFLLKEQVDPARLRHALADLRPRYPYFFVAVRRGFFWYYLERLNHLDPARLVRREADYPCRPLDLFSPRPALRVLYDRRRFSVELPHVVADGGGVQVFLKALLARYMELGGVPIPESTLPGLEDPPARPSSPTTTARFIPKARASSPRNPPPTNTARPACAAT